MASKESQGLQVALILFVMITIALAVTTYVYYRKAEEKIKETIAARDSATQAQSAMRQLDLDKQMLMHWIGIQPVEAAALQTIEAGMSKDLKDFKPQFDKDMSLFEGDTQEKNYRNLPQYLVDAIRDRNAETVALNDKFNQVQLDMTSLQQQEENKTKAAEAALEQEQSEKKTALAAYDQDRQRFVTESDNIKKATQTQLTSIQKKLDTVGDEKAQLEKDIETREKTIDSQKITIAGMRDKEFEVPDGRVIRLLPDGICWIDLGSADGLKRQVTFSVYDQDDNAVSREKPKGKIEVLEVLDQHLAQCRILFEERGMRILPNDLLFSPAWKSGRDVHFALAGFIDIDGDGRSDREILRNMITMQGGVIDAEAHDDGHISGAITVGTRYLVNGSPPIGNQSDPQGQADNKAFKAYSQMNGEADLKGVPKISVQKLLDLMGWKGHVRSIPLGIGAIPEDFERADSDGATRGSDTTRSFRRRAPTRGTEKSAYEE
ncbi:MAG: hypothetical protein R3C99_08265 [Pirellulaceae bacterium]|nr:hypothetical protein [Planctomycetales bacterium]MCA9204885.1 hypothetical protein [Planctomycetales bacterium]